MEPETAGTGFPLRVGLTGGIASGKSTVAELFASKGIPVLDTDLFAREVVRPGSEGLRRVVAEFGEDVLAADGSLDRRRMRERIFSDEAARSRLEAILHPLILAALAQASAAAGGPYQVHVIPLLAESQRRLEVDRVLVVDCDEEIQIARLQARDAEDEVSARRIIAAQAGRRRRLDMADDVIVNDGERAALEQSVDDLDRFYRLVAATGDFSRPGRRLP
jgi:dephospho-CoA kinase